MTVEEFEALVVAELDELPDDMVDGLDNIIFVVEDRPEDGSLDLLGLYDGVSLPARGNYGFGELPDRIILFREPLLAICADILDLRFQIALALPEFRQHEFELGNLAPLFVHLELVKADERFAVPHHSVSSEVWGPSRSMSASAA
jgi:predicted Zn-dependent protease with MMP-like domain